MRYECSALVAAYPMRRRTADVAWKTRCTEANCSGETLEIRRRSACSSDRPHRPARSLTRGMQRRTGHLRQGHGVKDQGELKVADNVALYQALVARSHEKPPSSYSTTIVPAVGSSAEYQEQGATHARTACRHSFFTLHSSSAGRHAALCWPLHRPTKQGRRSIAETRCAGKRRNQHPQSEVLD